MTSAKLTSKRQITIPRDVREALGLRTGDRLEFRLHENRAEVVKADQKIPLLSLQGMLRSRLKGITVEDMNQDLRLKVVRQNKKNLAK